MKIALISPYPDITSFGLRTISSYLKKHGHHVLMIFLPDPYNDDITFGVERYENRILEELIPLCRETDLIGISLMTNFFDGAVQITEKLKSATSAPILWGGVHPTIRPEESLQYADLVCIGEGEETIAELAEKVSRGLDYSGIPGLWLKSNGRIIKNALRPLSPCLDVYPIPDYDLNDHFIMFDNHIQLLSRKLMELFLKRGTVSSYLNKIGYQTMTGRGCPHKCTYCVNDTIRNLYGSKGYLRWRSVDHVMEELLWVKKNMPYVGHIWISDDAFFARPLQSIKHFCLKFKAKIGLPFSCLASPLTVTEEKMAMLVEAGLIYIQVGIESGSKRIQEIFNRQEMSNDRMMKAIRIVNKYQDKMFPPSYDFILDTPYETAADKIESLRFISQVPKPFRIQPFALVLYPGTKLYKKAQDDGLIDDEKREIYSKSYTMREPTYFNLLMILAKNGHFPSWLLRLFISNPVVSIFNNKPMKTFFKYLYIVLKKAYQILKRFRRSR